jgi:crotonobetainyl-CoA:carnitine CoA-transferase CaiB-like acyl-CoA transferase
MQQQELTYYFGHDELPPRPLENIGSIWATAPFGIYPTLNGSLTIAMTPCPVLAEALDLPFLAQFDTLDKMIASRPEIYSRLSEHLVGDTTEHWIELLLAHDVWCAPVQTYEQLAVDPQVAHNGLFWDVPVGEGEGTFRTPGSPITFSRTPASVRHGVPRMGQHTAELFSEPA